MGASPKKIGNTFSPYEMLNLEADSILVEDGLIKDVGLRIKLNSGSDVEIIDLERKGVTPGLIDFHTHPVFAATREDEFELRTAGASYSEIAAAGGGILNSVKKVRSASHETLMETASPFIDNALIHGTTTMEAKSGYGLSLPAEIKMLEVIRDLNSQHAMDLIPTFLGAHEVPLEFRGDKEGYIRLLIEEMIPAVSEAGLAQAVDTFCETGVFNLNETRAILGRAKEAGLQVKVHADQLTPLGGAKVAIELGALSADHIEFIDDETIEMFAKSSTVAGLLPVAAHFLRMKEDPPVRKMIEKGVICALATDFNPGSAMCENMQIALHLAVIRFRISAEEAFWMATAGSAQALGLHDRGWLGEGAKADFVTWNTPSPRIIPYHFGLNLVDRVIKSGEIAAEKGRLVG